MTTIRCKHVVAVAIAVIFSLSATAQSACDRTFAPVVSASFGVTTSGNFGSQVEAGVWGRNVPFSFYAGFSCFDNKLTAEQAAKDTENKTPETITAPYIRVGLVTYRNMERTFFNELTVAISRYPEVSYRLYKRYGEKLMMGIEPKVMMQNSKAIPAVSANFTFSL